MKVRGVIECYNQAQFVEQASHSITGLVSDSALSDCPPNNIFKNIGKGSNVDLLYFQFLNLYLVFGFVKKKKKLI